MMKIEPEKEISVNKPNDVRTLDLLHNDSMLADKRKHNQRNKKSFLGSVRFIFKEISSFVHYGCLSNFGNITVFFFF